MPRKSRCHPTTPKALVARTIYTSQQNWDWAVKVHGRVSTYLHRHLTFKRECWEQAQARERVKELLVRVHQLEQQVVSLGGTVERRPDEVTNVATGRDSASEVET